MSTDEGEAKLWRGTATETDDIWGAAGSSATEEGRMWLFCLSRFLSFGRASRRHADEHPVEGRW